MAVVAMMGPVVRSVAFVVCFGYRSRREQQRKNSREERGAYGRGHCRYLDIRLSAPGGASRPRDLARAFRRG